MAPYIEFRLPALVRLLGVQNRYLEQVVCVLQTIYRALGYGILEGPKKIAANHLARKKMVAPRRAPPVSGADVYWRSLRTACCAWLDCDSADMPVCSKTLYSVIFATVLPISAF